jgi:hypothetical protein
MNTEVLFSRIHLAPFRSNCGSVLSVHQDNCLRCGKEYADPQFREENCLTS